ncbi:MAG TPA: DoxX family protein [Thiobacillus sp.]|nr:DoxX family protein [Thiobacillus sp.]
MNTVFSLYARFEKIVQALSPAVDLAIRLYIAWVFFKSGLLKVQSWESTLALFEYEYAVPLLSTEMAATLGTAAELVLPVMLALGLAGRFAALALFAFNIVAVISYPDLSDVGRQHHLYWGMLLAMLAVHGPGLLSADGWLARRCQACPS